MTLLYKTHINGVDLAKLLQQTRHILLLGPLVQLAHPQGRTAHCHKHSRRRRVTNAPLLGHLIEQVMNVNKAY